MEKNVGKTNDVGVVKSKLPVWACVIIACILMFGNYVFLLGFMAIPQVNNFMKATYAGATAGSWIGFFIVLFTSILFVKLLSKYILNGTLKDVGFVFTKKSLPNFLRGWLFVFIGLFLTTVIVLVFKLVPGRIAIDYSKATVGLVILEIITKTFMGVVMQGIPEELLWRGWLMNTLREKPRTILVISAVFFGLLHYFSNGGVGTPIEHATYMLGAGAFAFLGGALALKYKSLWASIGVHGGYHLTNILLGMTGFYFETKEFWAIEGIIWIILGLIVLKSFKGDKVEFIN